MAVAAPLCRGVFPHGHPAAAGPWLQSTAMDFNLLIQPKRERFADLEGKGEESNMRYVGSG
jgi:hypothetical protein